MKASKTFTGNPKKASQFINSMKFPDVVAVQLAIQDQLKKANIKLKVKIAA